MRERNPLVGAEAGLLEPEPERACVAPTRMRPPAASAVPDPVPRPVVRGKFLFAGSQKLWVRGVTYGTFPPDAQGSQYPHPAVVERDFARMASCGVNALRVYTVPPRWLLDAAAERELRVMVGVPWEQHVTFLDDRARRADIVTRVRQGVRQCAGHPALLCYALGNEIPAPIVRWYGAARVERFLHQLYRTGKDADAEALITYVNYPSTEYLDLSFFDIFCFNVYLEQQERYAAYLQRLHNLAGERPLLMAELGLDSLRHGDAAQAAALDWQLRTSFAAGCSGAFVFAWTDEWYRGGYDIENWQFGLVTRARRPKEALHAVSASFQDVPFGRAPAWPRVSVVVCSYNGARSIRETLDGLKRLDYPDFEVIVVDDGSTDGTAALVAGYDCVLIRTENRGLSSARNAGLAAASGSIVAYIDDDAWPDCDWLKFLVSKLIRSEHVGVGGPNLPPPGGGAIAQCVANAPGGPTHVLVSDEVAEHIPGCNMAFRKSCLEAIGGFDPRFRTAGDDVDLCWRLQERGWTLGYSPAAVVWHHRRNSVRAYWKQQLGYGRAEALLEEKWPQRYNGTGHLTWRGRVYGRGCARVLSVSARIYHGTWGCAPFQRIYHQAPSDLACLPLMPEWALVIALLAALGGLGALWSPLYLFVPLLAAALLMSILQAAAGGARAVFANEPLPCTRRLRLRLLTAGLHLAQPVARLLGRLRHGLSPWRRRGQVAAALPWPRCVQIWDERWRAAEDRLAAVEAGLRMHGAVVLRGGEYDRFDLAIRGGLCGGIKTLMTIEEHGAGQLVRLRAWPTLAPLPLVLAGLLATAATAAALDQAWLAAAVLGLCGAALPARALGDCALAMGLWRRAVSGAKKDRGRRGQPGGIMNRPKWLT